MGLFGSLYTGVSGLRTSQNSLNTTAHNLANVGTNGFVRQQVVQTDSNYIKWGATKHSTLQYGLGVDISTVRQVRDSFLDNSYRKELGRQGFYDTQYETVSELESMFGELEGVTFQSSMDGFWSSIQELAKEPDSIVARAAVIQTSVSFLEHAENISKQLKEYQENLNTQIKNDVNRVNQIASEIDALNKQISLYESGGVEKANDLRDYRNNLLDELGKIMSITYKENSNSVVTVMAEGVPLVTEDYVNKMDTVKVSGSSNMLKPVWPFLDNTDVFDLDRAPSTERDTDIGSLKGLILSRGDGISNYTDIPIRGENESEESYNKRVTEFNNTVGASVIMSMQAQFDQLIHGVVTKINDILSPNKEVDYTTPLEVTLEDGTKMTLSGKVKVLDTDNAPTGMDEDKTMGEALFNRKSVDRYTKASYQATDAAGNPLVDADGNPVMETIYIYNEEDPSDNYSLFTLGEIEVNPEIMNNYSKIPLNSNNGTDGFDMKVAEALANAWNEPFAALSPNTLTVSTFKDYYTAMVGELATRGEQLNNMGENQEAMANNINNQRQQVMGVSSDEELTNLIKYQHAYNASSRYITVVDSMLEHLISRLG